ncbi:MAG: DNA integrity scanning protein DisA nucleotide-binding domain protein [Desulfosarcina sp.]|nr:DNA integrity scanning protein DisA nucleotide-binding domain protein [Desulfobacterales bacterium]
MPPFPDNLLGTIRWQDVIDILLNSYILFRLYILLRGTHLFRFAVFIAFLLVSQRAVSFYGMIITNTVLQYFTALVAIGVLIVFRYEIRRIFQSKSVKDIFWRVGTKPVQTPIEIISDSAFRMARRKVGALIVFKGNQPVDGLIQSGLDWQGRVSREMIESIFWPDNPVHDGAAVIEGDQIMQVSGILPLSDRKDLPSRFGTRHRAALGLADMSDALVLIVSEERGTVGIAKGGEIHEIDNPRMLEDRLRLHLGLSPEGIRRGKDMQWSAAVAAVLSLVIVTGIWSSFSLGVVRTLTTINAPIEYIRGNPDMEIIETSATSVNIQISGSRALINAISPNQVKVRFDLTNAPAGRNIITVQESQISLPRGAKIKKFDPASVEIMIDTPGRKKLPVQVDWEGRLPPGLLVQDVRLKPDVIEVIGGQMLIDRLATVYTEKVLVDNLNTSGEIQVAIALRPASLKLSAQQSDQVMVSYKLVPRR